MRSHLKWFLSHFLWFDSRGYSYEIKLCRRDYVCHEYGRPFSFIIVKWKGAVGAGSVRQWSVDWEVQMTLSELLTPGFLSFQGWKPASLRCPVRSVAKKEALLMCFSRAQIVPHIRISYYSWIRTLFYNDCLTVWTLGPVIWLWFLVILVYHKAVWCIQCSWLKIFDDHFN